MTGRKRDPFGLREFRGIDAAFIAKLGSLGIKTAKRILSAGRTQIRLS